MNAPRKPLFERLQQGLEQGIAHARGEQTLRTIDIPEEPPEIDPETLAALRERAAMSQAVFAKLLSVSAKTVQSWEQGVRRPSDAARRLIQVFSEAPGVVCRSAGLREVRLPGVEIVEPANGRRRIVVRKMGPKKMGPKKTNRTIGKVGANLRMKPKRTASKG